METSHIRSLAELGMEDPNFIHHWPAMNSFEELGAFSAAPAFGENIQHAFTQSIFDLKPSTQMSHTGVDRALKQQKTNSWNPCKINSASNQQAAPRTNLLPYPNSNYMNQASLVKHTEETVSSISTSTFPCDLLASESSYGNQNYVFKAGQGAKSNPTTKTMRISPTQDHILAERRRRERLSQRFIALSALVPGLKKMDKASVLGDAIKYLKQLQEQVKTLEEQTRKKSVESIVFVKKYELQSDGDNSSSDENFPGSPVNEPLPEIEIRFQDKDILIRIHCEKKKGALGRIVAEIEKLNLSVVNSSAMTFGGSALDITIIARMNVEFSMTVKDLVKNLNSALKLLF